MNQFENFRNALNHPLGGGGGGAFTGGNGRWRHPEAEYCRLVSILKANSSSLGNVWRAQGRNGVLSQASPPAAAQDEWKVWPCMRG